MDTFGNVTRQARFAMHQPRMKGNIVLPTILWIIAAAFVVAGIFALVRRQVLQGIALIVIGLLIGPGGVSIFT